MANEYIPLGELISFTSGTTVVDFTTGKSYLMDVPLGVILNHAAQVGGYELTDLDGPGAAAADGNLWTYTYHFVPDGEVDDTTNPATIEADFNALVGLRRGDDGSGHSGQTGTLVCERWDTSGGATASAKARLVNIQIKQLYHVVMTVELSFFIPLGGFN